jgi:hypothetical protein
MPQWNGQFPPVYSGCGFHLLLSTGRHITDCLRRDGLRAEWLPKGFSEDAFIDLRMERNGACTFGTRWPSRRALIHKIRQKGIDLEDVSGPFETLNLRMNGYQAGLVCNMPGRVPFGKAGRASAINRLWPPFTSVWPGVEPMAKTFEVAAAGCALVVDSIDELSELGFVDGSTCLIYRTFDDAVDLIRNRDTRQLEAIGRAGAELARRSHGWRRRAQTCLEILGRHG